MSHTIETTKRNIEAAYGVAFENIGFGMLAACVDGSPIVFRTNEKTGELLLEDAAKLHEKQSHNAGDSRN